GGDGRQKQPAGGPTRASYRCVPDYLEDLGVLLCAASFSSRLANCLSSHSRASAAAVRQVGVWSLRRGNRALRSMVAIDRNSRKFLACAGKRPALRAFSNVPYVCSTCAAPPAPSLATPRSF